MADSDTTQQVDVKKLLASADAIIANIRQEREARKKLLAEANAFIANCRQKRAEREDRKKLLAEGATQHAGIQKSLDSASAILANIQQKRADGEELDEAEWEEAIAEVKRLHREAREKLFANSQRKANLLPTGAELACASFLFGSLVAKALF